MGLEALHTAGSHDRVVLGAGRQLEAVAGHQNQRVAGCWKAEGDRPRGYDDHLVIVVLMGRIPIAGAIAP